MRLVRAVLVFTSVIVWSATAAAQVGISIQGLVLDGTLSALPGATVTATNLATGIARQAVSGEDGRYELAALAPAEAYELRVTQPGFAETRLRLTSLAAGEQRVVDVRMAVAGVAEALDVRPDATLARTPTPALGGTLSEEQVDSLPVNGRDLINLAYLIPGAAPARGFYNLAPRLTINGSSSLVTNYTIDGFDNTDLFLGGPKVPVTIGATQNLGVLVNSYSSEYGRTGNGVFAVTTRSGAQQHHGGAFYYARPGSSLDSPNFFAPRDASGNILDDSFRRNQVGGSIGGPLAARTFYFADVEVTREQQDAILTSPLGAGLAPTSFDSQTLTGKIDRYWNDTQSSSFKYIFSDYTHDKDIGFIGGLTLPSAGLVVNYHNQFLNWNHRSSIGGGFNELGVMTGRMRANWQTPDPGPRVAITDRGATLAVIGGVSHDFLWTETDLQVRNAYSRNIGRHAVKVGGDLLRAAFDIRSGPGALGSFTVDLAGRAVRPAGDFVTIADLPRDVSVLSYSQSFVNPRVERAQTLLAFFAEDTFRVASTLSVTAGVRWDYDSVTNTPIGDPDLNNIAPRGGFTWTPAFDPRGQIRGGAGLFFERIPFAVFSDTIFNAPQNGALGITFAPGTGFPPPAFPSTLPSNYYEQVPLGQLPPRNVQVFDPRLQTPRNRQLSLGYVRQVTNRLALSADYVNNRGDHLIRRIDTNAPSSVPAGVLRSVAAADATRTDRARGRRLPPDRAGRVDRPQPVPRPLSERALAVR